MSWFRSDKTKVDEYKEQLKEYEEQLKEYEEQLKEYKKTSVAMESRMLELEKKMQEKHLPEFFPSIPSDPIQTVLYYDGSLYQGTLENNLPHGWGIIVHGNGVRYSGEWKEGLYDGKGTLFYPNMYPWYAEWKAHKPHGMCTYDGVHFVQYENGVQAETALRTSDIRFKNE